jgi:two-component system, OmpR family, phosphate regulon sensor histidine kinase PhoR
MQLYPDKNITPRYLAIVSAIILFAISIIVLLFLNISFITIIVVSSIFGLSTGLIFFYTLNYFFYRKIKLIYKFISQTKANYQEESLQELLPQNYNINEVSEDVIKWAQTKHDEIEQLKSNELYRRDFLMNFSHEIKTPIFSVQGYLHTLNNGAINDINVRDKFLINATKGIDRLAMLVSEIDEISKLEIGEMVLIKTEFKILDLVQDAFEELQLDADAKHVSLSVKEGFKNDFTVYADQQKIKQALINLINNAIKYSNEGGAITAAVYLVDEKNVFLEITDHGIGIAEDQVPRVFERFYRTGEGRLKNSKGSGLGLAIVKHIIEAHGHTVTCRSALDVGSSFGFGLNKV